MLNDRMELASRSDADLVNGANLALLGEELIQFGTAQPLGAGRYRVRHLLRGRLGSEWACGAHQPGETFVLLDRAALTPVEAQLGAIGGALRVIAAGRDDGPDGASAVRTVAGDAVRPPSPVHLRVQRDGPDLLIRWVRRSRAGWPWLDGTDAPLGEEHEDYELSISGAGFARQIRVAEPRYRYSAADQAADGAAGATTIQIVQIGTHARSRPATATILIQEPHP
jgi:hypothetical protein